MTTTINPYCTVTTGTINTISGDKLLANDTTGTADTFGGKSYQYWGIRVYWVSSTGTKTEITSGTAVAITNASNWAGTGATLGTSTWSCPSTSVSDTNSIIEVDVYTGTTSPPTTLAQVFITPQLTGITNIDASTWTIDWYIYYVIVAHVDIYYYFCWGGTVAGVQCNSAVTNIQYKTGTAVIKQLLLTGVGL
jgi:hypothetical protein